MSGLVLRLAADADVPTLVEELGSHSAVEVGKLVGRNLPVVVESNGPGEARQTHDWMDSLAAVDRVEVVHVSFNE